MEIVVSNLAAAKTKRVTWNGRDYIVAPLTLIVPGVLPGSQGPLLYPPEEVRKNPTDWNGMPIVVHHPLGPNGKPTSARDPQILEKSGIGTVFNSKAAGKLSAEGWFDVQRTKEIDNRVFEALEKGKPMELSTGLTLRQYPVPEGTVHNGPGRTGPYVAIARDYKPDHLAILPDQKGACGIKDGCGLLVNAESPLARRSTYFQGLVLLTNTKKDQPRVPAGSPQGGQFAPKAGDVVSIQIGQHKGKKGTVLEADDTGLLIVKTPGGKHAFEVDEVTPTGKRDEESLKQHLKTAVKEDSSGVREETPLGLPAVPTAQLQKIFQKLGYIPLVGSDNPIAGGTPTQFTLAQLRKTSLQAGKELFDRPDQHEHLIYEKVHTVRYRHLDDLRKAGEGLGDFEYVFKPSTGKGVLTKSTDWRQISPKEAADKDGKIYSYSAEGIVFITETAKKGRKGRAHNELPVWDLIANRLEEVLNYNPSQARIPAGRPGGGQFATVKAAGAAVKKAESKVAKAQLTLEKAKAALKVEKSGLVVAKRGLAEAKSREKGTSVAAKSAISKAGKKDTGEETNAGHAATTKAMYDRATGVSKGQLDAHIETLRKGLNKEGVMGVARSLNIASPGKTKEAALAAIHEKIHMRRATSERVRDSERGSKGLEMGSGAGKAPKVSTKSSADFGKHSAETDVKSHAKQISLLESEAVAKGGNDGFKHGTKDFAARVDSHLASLGKSLNKQQLTDLLRELGHTSLPKTKAAGIKALRRRILGRREAAESLLT